MDRNNFDLKAKGPFSPDFLTSRTPYPNKGLKIREGIIFTFLVQGGSNMTGTDFCVNKPHCAAAVRP